MPLVGASTLECTVPGLNNKIGIMEETPEENVVSPGDRHTRYPTTGAQPPRAHDEVDLAAKALLVTAGVGVPEGQIKWGEGVGDDELGSLQI